MDPHTATCQQNLAGDSAWLGESVYSYAECRYAEYCHYGVSGRRLSKNRNRQKNLKVVRQF